MSMMKITPKRLRELDAKVAKLLGYYNVRSLSWGLAYNDENGKVREVPKFTMNASDDCIVLKFVRDNWTAGKASEMSHTLYEMWSTRRAETMERTLSWNDALMYEPGDYSLAVLESLGLLPS